MPGNSPHYGRWPQHDFTSLKKLRPQSVTSRIQPGSDVIVCAEMDEQWGLLPPHQAEIGRDVVSFAAGLRSAVRRNPEIIGVGEIRDNETADAAVQAGNTGHYCLSTMHTSAPRDNQRYGKRDSAQQCLFQLRFDTFHRLRILLYGTRLIATLEGKRLLDQRFCMANRLGNRSRIRSLN